ncbi:MAG: NYN domain-containing protein, partial [Bacteroidota bacterium]
VKISQNVAILIDGNNIERGIKDYFGREYLPNFDLIIPEILKGRSLKRLIYFKEGKDAISEKLATRLKNKFFGEVVPCFKSADIPLTINAVQLAEHTDCIVIVSGDSDYMSLLEWLQQKGIRSEVASTKRSMAKILKEQAVNYFIIRKEHLWEYKPDIYKVETGIDAKTPDAETKENKEVGNEK